jgi:hypothetical protein
MKRSTIAVLLGLSIGSTQAQMLNEPRAAAVTSVRWEFSQDTAAGVAPSGWQREPGSSDYNFRAVGGNLTLWNTLTKDPSADRHKIQTSRTDFKTGTYEYKFFLPTPPEARTMTSIGAWLLWPGSSDAKGNNRELDFEVGFGSDADRKSKGLTSTDRNWALAYMTVQSDKSSGQQHFWTVKAVRTGVWYIARFVLSTDSKGRYIVQWRIYADGTKNPAVDFVQTLNYGPTGAYPTTFYIVASLESLPFIGANLPTTSRSVQFDYVSYTP